MSPIVSTLFPSGESKVILSGYYQKMFYRIQFLNLAFCSDILRQN